MTTEIKNRYTPILLLSTFIGLGVVIIHPSNVSPAVHNFFKYLAISSMVLMSCFIVYGISLSINNMRTLRTNNKHEMMEKEYLKINIFMDLTFLFVLIGCCVYIK